MTIYIDADACPVTRIAERVAREQGIPVVLLCDTNHVLTSDYSEIKVIGAGADAVDIALINMCRKAAPREYCVPWRRARQSSSPDRRPRQCKQSLIYLHHNSFVI